MWAIFPHGSFFTYFLLTYPSVSFFSPSLVGGGLNLLLYPLGNSSLWATEEAICLFYPWAVGLKIFSMPINYVVKHAKLVATLHLIARVERSTWNCISHPPPLNINASAPLCLNTPRGFTSIGQNLKNLSNNIQCTLKSLRRDFCVRINCAVLWYCSLPGRFHDASVVMFCNLLTPKFVSGSFSTEGKR